MVKTCKVKVDKDTHTVEYGDEEYEKLICEVTSAKEGRNVFKCIHCKAKFTSKQRLNYHRLKGCDGALDINGKPLELKLYPSMPSGGAAEVRDIIDKHNLPVRNAFNCIHCNKECASEEQLDYHRSMCCPGVPDINGQLLQQKLFPSVPSVGAAEVRDISEKHNLHRVCELGKSDQLASFGEDVLLGSPLQLLCKDGSELPEALCVTPIVCKEHPESHEVSFLVMQDGLSFLPAYIYQEELDMHNSKEVLEVESEQEEEEKSESEEAPPKKSRKKTPAKISAPDSPPNASSKPVEKVYITYERKQNKEKEKEKKAKERKQRENEKETKEKEKGREKSTPRRGPGRPRKSDVTPGKSVGMKTKSPRSAAKDKDLAQGKKSDMMKDSKPRKSKKVPSDDELQSEIRELLKVADFSKLTYNDVITQLEGKFGVSLTEHKSHVKKLIKEEISRLADAEMDEGEPEPESEIETEAEAVTE